MARKNVRSSNITVIGSGSWGITLANVLYENGHSIILWEYDLKQAEKLKRTRSFISLGDYRIPKEIEVTSSLKDAVENADYLLFATPSQALGSVALQLSRIKPLRAGVFISAIKGFDQKTLQRPTEILRTYFKNKKLAVLSGPSHAEEVINKVPTAIVIASSGTDVGSKLQKLFSNLYFRVYTSNDVKGVELGGALKNVIAVASGISSGLNMGDNTKAALITRGNLEITRLGKLMGAKRDTFSGLSGIGDLIVTCFSEHSRNFRFGKYIGTGSSVEQALKKVKTTVEGVYSAKSCFRLARKYGVKMPVCNTVYEILYKGKSAEEAWKELMTRPLRSETF